MSNYTVDGSDLTSIANAIRTKGGTSASLSFPDGFVQAVGNISIGASPTLITKNITSNGTYDASDDSADGYSEVTVNVPTTTIKGTFTGTASGAMTVNIPYTGNGYPVSVLVYPSVGAYKSGTTIYETVQKSVLLLFLGVKTDTSSTPSYTASGNNDNATILALYKNSTSDATTTSANRTNTDSMFNANAATATWASSIMFSSATSMSVFIADSSYGFMQNVEYTYEVTYSS